MYHCSSLLLAQIIKHSFFSKRRREVQNRKCQGQSIAQGQLILIFYIFSYFIVLLFKHDAMEMHEKNETPWLKSLITGEPGDKQQSTDTTAEQSPESTGEPGDRRTWRQVAKR